MINFETFDFITKNNIKLQMNLYRATNMRKNITILYFHGGGLLYGVRDDLPEIYINKFLSSGYDLLTLDYPLAPESGINEILISSYEEILYFLKNHDEVFSLKSEKYILFGRSAGAYLCFMMCNMLIKNNVLRPADVISLYGYSRLDEPQFNTESKYYNKLAKVTDESIKKIVLDSPVTYGPMNIRFSLYIKARQEGTWIKQLCNNENPSNYSLNEETLKCFPPTLLVAATGDPDVPYKISKSLSKVIPNTRLITIYEDVHDFDRDISNNSGNSAYEEIINWLDTVNNN